MSGSKRLDDASLQRFAKPGGISAQDGIHICRAHFPCAILDLVLEVVRRPEHQPDEIAGIIGCGLDDAIDSSAIDHYDETWHRRKEVPIVVGCLARHGNDGAL